MQLMQLGISVPTMTARVVCGSSLRLARER